ncbi:MAG TPA: heme o synthase [Bacteroidota bacterium]|nr:heme o synthase [Bacteroidota bacterium]
MRSNLGPHGAIALERSRFADYLTLTKPELTFLSVVTALAGFYMGTGETIALGLLLHTLVGTALVGGGAGALNQYIERDLDGLMRRTENRPLPSGRLGPWEVLIFGSLLSLAGLAQLSLFVNALTGFLAAATLVSYLFLYTPLKRITPLSTLVGGIPGAIPPMMGWTAVKNEISQEAWILFAILFLWQMPHFFSLAWMYRKDYARAGYKMLTVLDPKGDRTSRQILFYCGALIPTTMIPVLAGYSGFAYMICALFLGTAFLLSGIHLVKTRSNDSARRVFLVSLLYLPALLLLMVIDRV